MSELHDDLATDLFDESDVDASINELRSRLVTRWPSARPFPAEESE